MTDLELIRLKLADNFKFAFDSQETDGETTIFKLSHGNIDEDTFELSLDDSNVDTSLYTVDYDRGIIVFDSPPDTGKILEATYDYTIFSDSEINSLLSMYTDVNVVMVELIDILLADSARRFDYTSGQTEMKPKQVFDNLKQLRDIYSRKGGISAKIANRTNNYYKSASQIDSDLSRSD